MPELTDEWVAANTESKTADEYKAAVKKELEANAEEMALYQLYGDAWYTVLENSEVLEYPKEDVEKASEAYKEMYKQYLDQAQMDMSEFLRSQDVYKRQKVDTLILGCTHYPLIRSTIREFMGEEVRLVNPAYETALDLRELLGEMDLVSTGKEQEEFPYRFYVSDLAEKFKAFANSIPVSYTHLLRKQTLLFMRLFIRHRITVV